MIAALARHHRQAGAIAAALPGIRVVAAPAPAADPLPRMDVAAFAGFTSAGPVHCPVAVDSVAAFAAVFGADPPLAWDSERGTITRGLLGPAVRAFFENGGRRAFVIRLARTEALEGQWLEAPSAGVAHSNRFVIPGVLALDGAQLGAARARARSLGSWSDRLQVRARCKRAGFRVRELREDSEAGTLRFAAAMPLLPGELVELGDAEDSRRAYARMERTLSGEFEARLLASFVRLTEGPARLGLAAVPGLDDASRPARLVPGERTRLEWLETPPEALLSGHLLSWEGNGDTVYLVTGSSAGAVVEAGGDAIGPAWTLGDAAPLPTARAARVTLDLRVEDGADTASLLTGLGLTPDASSSWWSTLADDRFYRPGDPATVRAPLASEDDPAPLAWLPLGLDGSFGLGLPPLPHADDALVRDGLARFDAELFLDPRLASRGLETLVAEAERILAEPDGRLLGIHGVLAVPPGAGQGDLPSIIALPDAAHAGWEKWRDEAPAPPLAAAVPAPTHWVGHRGACPEDPGTLTAEHPIGPAFDKFLDCGTRVLPTPELLAAAEPITPGPLIMRWTASEPSASYVLELSAEADMAGAVEIARVEATEHPIMLEREGVYYFRLTAERGGELSRPSLASVRVRASSWRALPSADLHALAEVHRAMLRLVAAEGSLFALLSLPRGFDGENALAAAAALRSPRSLASPAAFAAGERRALSHGMLLHGWLLDAGRPTRPGDPAPLAASPPCGAIAGILARRTLAGGAWLSPANQKLRGPVALAGAAAQNETQALIDAHIMPLREQAEGFVLADARTLADEEEWSPVGTRRLFGLLRRLVTNRAPAYAFEPNRPMLHRTIERGLGEALLMLFRAGAFAGFKPAEAFRVTVRADQRERDLGRLVTEIAVAPACPLAFLTLVLRQTGERLTFEEAR